MLPVFAEADFVVVGAGSAGSFIAAKLAETEGVSVVVIEAGPAGRNPLLSVPLLTGHFLRSGRYTWPFETTPQAHLDGRRLKWPRGRVVGGSGAINGMVWARGLPSDYDHWAQRGLLGWSWEKVEPVFQALEAMPEVGGGKALGIEQPAWWTELYDAFLTGAESVGCGRTEDFNGAFPSGVGRYQFNIRSGRRASTGALLQRAAARGRLRLLTDTHTLRLEIAEGRAQSVLVSRGGSSGRVVARREIILAAGTVGSPQILLASGIGPGGDLAELGLPIHVDSPEVGRNLQDHLLVRVEHAATKPGGLNRLLRADRAALALLNALMFGSGPAACFPLLVGGFLKSDPALAEPDLQSHFMPALTSATIRVNPFRAPPGMRDGDGFSRTSAKCVRTAAAPSSWQVLIRRLYRSSIPTTCRWRPTGRFSGQVCASCAKSSHRPPSTTGAVLKSLPARTSTATTKSMLGSARRQRASIIRLEPAAWPQNPKSGCRSIASRARRHRVTRYRCIGDAGHHLGQH